MQGSVRPSQGSLGEAAAAAGGAAEGGVVGDRVYAGENPDEFSVQAGDLLRGWVLGGTEDGRGRNNESSPVNVQRRWVGQTLSRTYEANLGVFHNSGSFLGSRTTHRVLSAESALAQAVRHGRGGSGDFRAHTTVVGDLCFTSRLDPTGAGVCVCVCVRVCVCHEHAQLPVA